MPRFRFIFVSILLAGTQPACPAAAFSRRALPAGSQWFVHIDMPALRASRVGRYLERDVMPARLRLPTSGLAIDAAALLAKINELTIYGSGPPSRQVEDCVFLVRGDRDLPAMLEAVMATSKPQNGPAPALTQTKPYPIYQYSEGYVAFLPSGLIVFAPGRPALDQAAALDSAPAAGPRVADRFPGKESDEKGAFLVAGGIGLDHAVDAPPLLQFLQMADGGRFMAREAGGDTSLELLLRTPSESDAHQLSRVVQGVLALASLMEIDGQKVLAQAKSVAVEPNGPLVQVTVVFPAESVVRFAAALNRAHGAGSGAGY